MRFIRMSMIYFNIIEYQNHNLCKSVQPLCTTILLNLTDTLQKISIIAQRITLLFSFNIDPIILCIFVFCIDDLLFYVNYCHPSKHVFLFHFVLRAFGREVFFRLISSTNNMALFYRYVPTFITIHFLSFHIIIYYLLFH